MAHDPQARVATRGSGRRRATKAAREYRIPQDVDCVVQAVANQPTVTAVVPVLTYSMGTWGLTKAELDRLDTYHRRHLRQVIGIHWPNRISNAALYRRCRCHPISEDVKSARWRLFGHVLRMPLDAPAQQAIDYYFADTGVATFRGRPRTTLPTALNADLRRVGRTLRRHRRASPTQPRTMATTGAGHSRRIVDQLIKAHNLCRHYMLNIFYGHIRKNVNTVLSKWTFNYYVHFN